MTLELKNIRMSYSNARDEVTYLLRGVDLNVEEGKVTALVGGNGTAYADAHVDAKYAHIDAADAPGYFTAAGADVWSCAELDEETGVLTLSGNITVGLRVTGCDPTYQGEIVIPSVEDLGALMLSQVI